MGTCPSFRLLCFTANTSASVGHLPHIPGPLQHPLWALSKMPASLLLEWRASFGSLQEKRVKEGSSLGPEPQWKQGSASPGNFCLRYFLVTQLSSPSNWDKGKELAVPKPRLGTQPGPVVNCCVPGLTVPSCLWGVVQEAVCHAIPGPQKTSFRSGERVRS